MVLEFIPGCCLWTPVNGLHLLYRPPISNTDPVVLDSFSLGGWASRRSFFSRVLRKLSKAVVQRRDTTALPCSWRWLWGRDKPTSLPFLQLVASCWALSCSPSQPPSALSILRTLPRVCFLWHNAGEAACPKTSRHPVPSLQIWGDYKKKKKKREN